MRGIIIYNRDIEPAAPPIKEQERNKQPRRAISIIARRWAFVGWQIICQGLMPGLARFPPHDL